MQRERYSAVLHTRHGWIEAPEGSYFRPSATGKSVELHEPNRDETRTDYFYPYGTTFRASSIIAYS